MKITITDDKIVLDGEHNTIIHSEHGVAQPTVDMGNDKRQLYINNFLILSNGGTSKCLKNY